MIKNLSLAALFASALIVSACNTVKGAGRDLESAGSAVKNSAVDATDGKPN